MKVRINILQLGNNTAIEGAKAADTRARRVEKAIATLLGD